jgi:pyridinium-3,5-biscarboxylic acid mononucleotide synthase
MFKQGFPRYWPSHQFAKLLFMTQPDPLKALLQSVAQGELNLDVALMRLKQLTTYETVDDFARVDHQRAQRTGFPEVIWGPGKTPTQIARIMETLRDQASVVMATRITPEVHQQICKQVSDVQYFPEARISALVPEVRQLPHPGTIGILSAGTADLSVAEEAAITAELSGFRVSRLWDVGVAGLHRLLSNRHLLEEADVLIVVAGMEGALPSVVGGLVNCPVIAVPTSVGYGASFGGLSALLGMLNSCATGIGVMNIDNGFGAAMLACQILRTGDRLASRP